MKYRCGRCHKPFDEPEYRILKDKHQFSVTIGSHELAIEVCPYCGSGLVEPNAEGANCVPLRPM
jgi:DNA-directed RNA polymerase subunit RPC12/RpoP